MNFFFFLLTLCSIIIYTSTFTIIYNHTQRTHMLDRVFLRLRLRLVSLHFLLFFASALVSSQGQSNICVNWIKYLSNNVNNRSTLISTEELALTKLFGKQILHTRKSFRLRDCYISCRDGCGCIHPHPHPLLRWTPQMLPSFFKGGGEGGIFFRSFDTCKEDTAHVHMWVEAGFLQLWFLLLPSIGVRVAVGRGKIRAQIPPPPSPCPIQVASEVRRGGAFSRNEKRAHLPTSLWPSNVYFIL